MSKEEAIQLTDKHFMPDDLLGPRNAKTTMKLLADPGLDSVGKYGELDIFHVTTGLESKYFCVHNNLIVYYMQCKVYSFAPITNAACQVGVWRDPHFPFMKRGTGPSLAEHVFQKILVPKYKEVFSDKIQTDFGRYFWIKQIEWALSHSKCAYLVKVSGEDVGKVLEIQRIKDWKEFETIHSKAWGKTLKDQRVRLLISEEPVFFPSKK